MKLKVLKPAVLALAVAGILSGCAVKEAPVAKKVKCGPPDFCMQKPAPKLKKVYVSECPKKVKTVVYGTICDDCTFPVSVREKSCCVEGGCK